MQKAKLEQVYAPSLERFNVGWGLESNLVHWKVSLLVAGG